MYSRLLQVAAVLALIVCGRAADLVSSGDWNQAINATHLVSGAGSNLQAQFESVAGVTVLTISNAPGAWTLRARLIGSGGHSNVTIHIRRASPGSGSGDISGGTAYQALTGSDAELFSGTEARSGVSLQLKITGLSCHVSPANYLSSISFTVQ